MLRKKYVFSKIYKELDFLVQFYRNKNEKNDKLDKKNKKLALKIEDLSKKESKLDKYVQDYISMKQIEFRLRYYEFELGK